MGGNQVRFRTSWGRVGVTPQSKEKEGNAKEVERLIQEKRAKGYQELDLHVPEISVATPATPAAPQCPPKVTALLDMIFKEAGESIAGYLAVSVDALSQSQITYGRDLLEQTVRRYQLWKQTQSQADFSTVVTSVKDFYNAIPTQLPHNLRDSSVLENVVLRFCQDFAEQETRLNQLEAALATSSTATPSRTAMPTPYQLLGAGIVPLSQNDTAYEKIADFLAKTSRHGYAIRVRDIFEIEVPSERAAFKANTFGANQILRLTHGTNNANIRHILHERGNGSGLRVPRSYTNGWMFGPGIYFANVASKSAQYCRHQQGHPRMMFLADVAVGNMYITPEAMSSCNTAPQGYHSVWGKEQHTTSWGGKLAYDEFIVYRAEQQSLRYLITWDA